MDIIHYKQNKQKDLNKSEEELIRLGLEGENNSRPKEEILEFLAGRTVTQLRKGGFVEVGRFRPEDLAGKVTLLRAVPGQSFDGVRVVDRTLISDNYIPGKEYVVYAKPKQ
ncbi:MAG: hypothetical protein AABX29_09565 [Nanoarchaeota archaeon]